ncbi:fungal-specific transcription factor domain-containing protein [Blakeslea trispora]|nr:fungal-specific transcription factor domain-containing protein [Blakeslea trispora]
MEGASTCKNCISYEKGCTYTIGSKKRGPPRGYTSILESRLERIEGLITNMTDKISHQSPSPTTLAKPKRKAVDDQEANSARAFIEKIKDTDLASDGKFVSGTGISFVLTKKIGSLKDSALTSLYGLEIQHNENSDHFYVQKTRKPGDRLKEQIRELVVVGLLKPNESVNNIDEWIFRVARITKTLSDKLLKVYFAFIHPQLPVINKTTFLEEYRGIRETFPSGPLLNAMYGAAVRYIDNCKQFGDSELLNKGEPWQFPYNFSHILFQNLIVFIKGRYSPCLSSIQAIVIAHNLSASLENWTSGWLLNCIAMRMSQDIGLHRSTDGWDLTPEDKETRRMVWWSVYLLDRWLSAGTGRPLTAFDEDCDEIYPSENVNVDVIMDTVTEKDQHLPRFPSLDTKVADKISESTVPLNSPFIQLLKLSKILGQILQGLYSPKARRHSEKYGSDAIVSHLDKALSDWRSSLPPLLQICRVGGNMTLNKSHTPIISMTGMICLSYCTVLILLYRPFIQKPDEQSSTEHSKKSKLSSESSLAICTSAANRIVEVSESMHYRDFLMVSWGFALYPVFTAALIHIYNCSSADASVSESAKLNLVRALAVVDKLCLLSPVACNMGDILKKIIAASPFFQSQPSVLASLEIQGLNIGHSDSLKTNLCDIVLNQVDKRDFTKQADETTRNKRAKTSSTSVDDHGERISLLRSRWFPKAQHEVLNMTNDKVNYTQDEDWLKELYLPSAETNSVEECISSKATDLEDAYSIRQFGLDGLEFVRNLNQPQNGSQQFHTKEGQVPTASSAQMNTNHLFGMFDSLIDIPDDAFSSVTDSGFMNYPFPSNETASDSTKAASEPSMYSMNEWARSEQAGGLNSITLDPPNQTSSAQFIHRPGNPFWGVPSSFEVEDWQTFLIQYQELMKEQRV